MKSLTLLLFCTAAMLLTSCSKSEQITGLYNGQISTDNGQFDAICEITSTDADHVKVMTVFTSGPSGSSVTYENVTVIQNSSIYTLATDDHLFMGTVSVNVISWEYDGANDFSFTGTK